jgi:hypothetical protein
LPANNSNDQLGKAGGFSLHAGVSIKAKHRDKLERLCRYIARPAVSLERISKTQEGNINYELKTPYRDGTTSVEFEPLDFISKLSALIPAPRINLVRYHGVFAPNSKLRDFIITKHRNSANSKKSNLVRMRWSVALKRAFKIDLETCEYCGGSLKIINYK